MWSFSNPLLVGISPISTSRNQWRIPILCGLVCFIFFRKIPRNFAKNTFQKALTIVPAFFTGGPSSVEAKFQHELSGARQGLRRDLREAFGAMNAATRCGLRVSSKDGPNKNEKEWGLYPLVNIQKTMENHHFEWENSLFLWPCSIAMLNYQRVSNILQIASRDKIKGLKQQ